MSDRVSNQPNDPVNDTVNDVDWWASRLIDQEIAFADVPADLRGAVHERVETFGVQRRALLRLGADHRVDSTVTDRAIAAASNPPEAIVVPLRRRLVPLLGVAAATMGVIVVGVSVLGSDDRPDVIAVEASESASKSNDASITADPTRASPNAATEMVPPVDGSALAMSVDTVASDEATPDPWLADAPREPMPSDVTEIADMIELADLAAEWRTSPPPLLDGPAACEDDQGRPAVAVNVRFSGIDAQAYYSPDAGVMLLAVADCLKLASIVP